MARNIKEIAKRLGAKIATQVPEAGGGAFGAARLATSFDDLVNRTTTKKTRVKAARRAQELLAELLLGEVRQLAGKSPQEVAEALGMKQPSLSKLEKQTDMQISTLRKIITALGGELEVLARFPKGTVKIDQFDPAHRRSRRQGPGDLQLI